jgi:hypothetical protein
VYICFLHAGRVQADPGVRGAPVPDPCGGAGGRLPFLEGRAELVGAEPAGGGAPGPAHPPRAPRLVSPQQEDHPEPSQQVDRHQLSSYSASGLFHVNADVVNLIEA